MDGVKIKNRGGFDDDDIRAYIRLAEETSGGIISEITLTPAEEPGKVKIEYVALHRKFERIRRITGYLVGTIDRWNNAKRSEEHDRVKHN